MLPSTRGAAIWIRGTWDGGGTGVLPASCGVTPRVLEGLGAVGPGVAGALDAFAAVSLGAGRGGRGISNWKPTRIATDTAIARKSRFWSIRVPSGLQVWCVARVQGRIHPRATDCIARCAAPTAALPRHAPCWRRASIAKWLQLGSKRHCAPMIGRIVNWYARTAVTSTAAGGLMPRPCGAARAGDRRRGRRTGGCAFHRVRSARDQRR